jgi:hypothetical protein
VSQCPNCSAELEGQYCSACGQRRIDPGDLSARRFVHEVADQVATSEFKFKTLRTLRALLTPGLLTTEFLAGRRQRYLGPIKVYFVCAAIFFLAAPLAGFTLQSLIADDQSGDLMSRVAARAGERGLDPVVLSQRFDLRLPSVYTLTLGSGVIAVAAMLRLLFRRTIPFGAHVIFALHYFSFLYLVTATAGSTRRFGLADEVAATIAVLLIVPYLFIALKRAYLGSIPWTLLKSAVLLLLTFAFNYVADAGAIRLTLALL